jgi:hypothetical protein
MFDRFELERPGRDEPFGVGAIRVFITKVSRAREEIVELVPERRLSYVSLSGLPLRNYRADVDIAPEASGGAVIDWRASFEPKHFGTGWFWRLFMARAGHDRTPTGLRGGGSEDPCAASGEKAAGPVGGCLRRMFPTSVDKPVSPVRFACGIRGSAATPMASGSSRGVKFPAGAICSRPGLGGRLETRHWVSNFSGESQPIASGNGTGPKPSRRSFRSLRRRA